MSVPDVPHIIDGIEVEFTPDGNWIQKRYRAAELPEVLARDRDVLRAAATALVQFCRDWRAWPEDREWMLEGAPDLDANDPYDLAKVAAVIRGLCERWQHPTPDWIEGIRAPTAILLFLEDTPLHPPYERQVRALAPPACAQHGVYYEADMLEYKEDVMQRLRTEMRAAREQNSSPDPLSRSHANGPEL